MVSKLNAAALVLLLSACATKADSKPASQSPNASASAAVSSGDTPPGTTDANSGQTASGGSAQFRVTATDSLRVPNELGHIPVVEYHLIVDKDAQYSRDRVHFAQDLEFIYQKGYRPVTISQLLDRKINLPRGLSPIVFVFDDASPSQFRYIEKNGQLEIDPTSGRRTTGRDIVIGYFAQHQIETLRHDETPLAMMTRLFSLRRQGHRRTKERVALQEAAVHARTGI